MSRFVSGGPHADQTPKHLTCAVINASIQAAVLRHAETHAALILACTTADNTVADLTEV
jgi:hypothetical protein